MSAVQDPNKAARYDQMPHIKGSVSFNEPMSLHTSFRIGGPVDLFAVPEDVEGLRLLLEWAHDGGIPVLLVGAGTNLLVSDKGIRGLVLKLGSGFDRIAVRGKRVVAGGAAKLPLLVRKTLDSGLSGLEGLSGVPGTVGGAVCMNAGTPLGCVGDTLESVEAIDMSGRTFTLNASDLGLAYRQSRVGEMRLVVAEATFALRKSSPGAIKEVEAALLEKRDATQPYRSKTAGSTFKNPRAGCAGEMIEAVGAKGMRVGGAQVSALHANFIENVGNASAADVRQLMTRLQVLVRDRFGVELQPEIQLVGEW